EPVDPGVVARLDAAVVGHVLELRPWKAVERPALGAVLASGVWPVERAFALAAVEAAEVPARERGPEHAVAADIAAARPVAREGRLVDLGDRGVRRVRARRDANDVPGVAHRGPPHRAVERIDVDAVHRDLHALVLRRVERLARLDPFVAPAVAVRVEDE